MALGPSSHLSTGMSPTSPLQAARFHTCLTSPTPTDHRRIHPPHLNREQYRYSPRDTAREASATTLPASCLVTLFNGSSVISPCQQLILSDHFSRDPPSSLPSFSNNNCNMRRYLETVVLATISLAWAAHARNYSSIDIMRTQLALMDDRPDECPPWYEVLRHPRKLVADRIQF